MASLLISASLPHPYFLLPLSPIFAGPAHPLPICVPCLLPHVPNDPCLLQRRSQPPFTKVILILSSVCLRVHSDSVNVQGWALRSPGANGTFFGKTESKRVVQPCPDSHSQTTSDLTTTGLWGRALSPLEAKGGVLCTVGAGECDSQLCDLQQVTHGLRAYDGLSLPEDAETATVGRVGRSYSDISDDEDLLADDASGGEQKVLVTASGRGWQWGVGVRVLPTSSLKRPREALPRGCLKRWAKSCVQPRSWYQ